MTEVVVSQNLDHLLRSAISYIEEVLGEVGSPREWEAPLGLPIYLADRYLCFVTTIVGNTCLLAVQRRTTGDPPATIKKHVSVLADLFLGEVVYVGAEVTAYNRKRLIEHRVSFVVPRRQLYLPGFGIDLRERFAAPRKAASSSLGGVAQLLLLREVYYGDTASKHIGEWAIHLNYSAMTVSRAIDELLERGLVQLERDGRSKRAVFSAQGNALWSMAKNEMQSPVRKVTWVKHLDLRYKAPLAGESALARYTMLSEPEVATVAIFDRNAEARETLIELPADVVADVGGLKVERWRYDPRMVKPGKLVDELSLWLSLQGQQDERVLLAADTMLEQVAW